MLHVYTAEQGGLSKTDVPADGAIPPAPVWIDLLHPTLDEDHAVEDALGIGIPTRAEMEEIEISSRLYQENGAVYMTALVLAGADTDQPQATAITFIRTGECVVTVRYAEPKSFVTFAARAQRPDSGYASSEAVLLGLLESLIDRTADILERIGGDVDGISRRVFEPRSGRPGVGRDFQDVLRDIGRRGDLISKVRESLVSVGRLLAFLQAVDGKGGKSIRTRLKTISRDVDSLADHVSFLSGKIGFLLEATLGMINIEQNAIIKIFSVMAVIFLPPTLIASIYGMNFEHMPELQWTFGYPLAILLMILAAVLPYRYFKWRGWL